MTAAIHTENLSRRYRDQVALDQVSLDVAEDGITGLLGRNGAGKSTLMRLLTGQEFATSGTMTVFGEDPVENDHILRKVVFVREDQVFPDFKVRHALELAAWFYPNWSSELADTLVADFDLPRDRRIKKLSRGMRSALSIVLGLSARAELTLLDEPYAGLDAVARQLFYDRLLEEHSRFPRTVLLSTHLVDEAAGLLEHVVLIDRGRIALDAPADEARGKAVTVSGPSTGVQRFVQGRHVWHRREIGARAAITVGGGVDADDRALARELGLTLEPLSLQQLMVHSSGEQDEMRATA